MRPGRQEGNTQLVCGGKTTHYQQQVELVLTWIEHTANQKADDYVLLCCYAVLLLVENKRFHYSFFQQIIERAWPPFDVLCCI